MTTILDSENKATRGQEEEGGESISTKHSDNQDSESNSVNDTERRVSDVTVTVELKEEDNKNSAGSAFDPKQFFTQLGTVVAVFGVTMDMLMTVIDDITAQNFNGILANGLILGLIHMPTLCALLYVLCKDKVKLAVKGAIFISKMFVKKKKSQAERGAKTLVNKSDPRKLAAMFQNKDKGNGYQKDCDPNELELGLGDVCEIKSSRENNETGNIVSISNEIQPHYESSVDRDSISWSDRTLTPRQSYNASHQFGNEQGNDPDNYQKRHGHSKTDKYYDTRRCYDTECHTSSESYQSFMETPRPAAKQRDLYNGVISVSSDVNVMSERVSRKHVDREEYNRFQNTDVSSRDKMNSYSNAETVSSHESSSINSSRINARQSKRVDVSIERNRSPSNSSRNFTNRVNGDFKKSDTLYSNSNKHPYKRNGDYHDNHKNRGPTENYKLQREKNEQSDRKRSKSREEKNRYPSGSDFVSNGDRGITKKSGNGHSNERKFGGENFGFRNDEENQEYYFSLENGSGNGKRIEKEVIHGTAKHGSTNGSDTRVERRRDDERRTRQRNTRDDSTGRQLRSLSSSRHRVYHPSDNHQLADYSKIGQPDHRENELRSTHRSRSKIKMVEVEQPHINGDSIPRLKASSKSTSNSNENVFELESDEETILRMIRQITEGKARKEMGQSQTAASKQQSQQRQKQQLKQQQQKQHRSTNKESRNQRTSKPYHIEGSTVVDIEDRDGRHGRRKK